MDSLRATECVVSGWIFSLKSKKLSLESSIWMRNVREVDVRLSPSILMMVYVCVYVRLGPSEASSINALLDQ